MARLDIFKAIDNERTRQENLKAQGKFRYTCADSSMSHAECLSVLVEEVGELGHEINERINRKMLDGALWDELVQVAAVSVAWLERVYGENNGFPVSAKCRPKP